MSEDAVIGVILAGGLARRMGGQDKGLLQLGGKPILEHVIKRLEPQVDAVILNSNSSDATVTAYGLPIVPDIIPDRAGPLAGVLSGMEWVRANRPAARWIVTAAVDTPFFPMNLVSALLRSIAEQNAELACAASNDRHHPVFGMWPVRLTAELRHAVTHEGIRKVDAWTSRYRLATADFTKPGYDPFFNVNRPEDLEKAGKLAAEARP